MLSVEMTVMPASRSASTSSQRFSCREPGHVGVGELVDEGDRGPAREDRVDVHLLEGRAAVLDAALRGTTSRPSSCAAVFGRPWVST